MSDKSTQSSYWFNNDKFPIILYFGAVSTLSTLYLVMKFFGKFKRKSKTSERQPSDKNVSEGGEDDRKKFSLSEWFANMFINLRVTRMNEYFPSKQEKRWGVKQPPDSDGGERDELKPKQFRFIKNNGNISSKVDPSTTVQDDENRSLVSGHQSRSPTINDTGKDGHAWKESLMEDGGSLARVIITEIEQHQNERKINREIEEFQRQQKQLEEEAGKKDSKDERIATINVDEHKNQTMEQGERKPSPISPSSSSKTKTINSTTTTKIISGNNYGQGNPIYAHMIDKKLNVPLNYLDYNDTDEDPIYDIPSSRSLINLITIAEINLPTKQKGHNNPSNNTTTANDVTYFHTSSPNLLSMSTPSIMKNSQLQCRLVDEEEESIYDTPKSSSCVDA